MYKISYNQAQKLLGWKFSDRISSEMPTPQEFAKAGCNHIANKRHWLEQYMSAATAGLAISKSNFGTICLTTTPSSYMSGYWSANNPIVDVFTSDGRRFIFDQEEYKIVGFDINETGGDYEDAEPNIVTHWLLLDQERDRAAACLN